VPNANATSRCVLSEYVTVRLGWFPSKNTSMFPLPGDGAVAALPDVAKLGRSILWGGERQRHSDPAQTLTERNKQAV
jgi:hypothetical protein